LRAGLWFACICHWFLAFLIVNVLIAV
jgi:hypothetical protein